MKNKTIWWIVGIVIVVILIGYVVSLEVRKSRPGNIEPPLIGGCAGVALENQQECCETWARENRIVHVACVGSWRIKDNQCSWDCS